MVIIAVDYHPSDQYIEFVDTETGEYSQWLKFSSHAGQLVTGHGVN
jgi:hypothetical protein